HLCVFEVEHAPLGALALVLEPLGLGPDRLLARAVALLLVRKLPEQLLGRPAALGPHRRAPVGQVGLEPELLAPVLVLADRPRLVKRPLIGGLLLREQHLPT